MNRKEKIYAYMNTKEYLPLTFDELRIMLDVPDSAQEELAGILNELISEGKVFLSKKKRYAVCEHNRMYSGVLRCSERRRFGFVICEGHDDIFVPEKAFSTAIDGDRVLVKAEKPRGGRTEGVVFAVLERGNSILSAVVTDNFRAQPDNRRIFKALRLTETLGAKPGDRILAEITGYLPNGEIEAAAVTVLGSSTDLKTLTEAIIFGHGIKPSFSREALSQADSIAREIKISDYPGRRDFTADTVFTIDGADARDFDDAVSIKQLPNGNYELGVHIADVTEYVTENSPLDFDARERGTSVYLADRVIPMLPVALSNGICSLNPNVNRLTLSVIMEIDSAGRVVGHELVKGIICSCRRMTYDDTAKILSGDSALCAEYADILPSLLAMARLSDILARRRTERGSINFDFPETKIILGSDGRPQDIVRIERNAAHRLIEEFMLAANETVAEAAFWADLPFVYRVHEQPDTEKMDSFKRFIGGFGLTLKGTEVHPKALQQILDKIKGSENEALIASSMLRSLAKAEYKPECNGHFGLAAQYYCHFTSPIRRYPDLIIHRILKDFIDGRDLSHYNAQLADISAHSSDTERRAELCERDVQDLFKTAYIADFIGAEFDARVSGTASFGMFAELENGIEGMIRLETMEDDYYEFEEEQRRIIGRRHRRSYRIGDSVRIEVVRADLELRQIDFVLAGSKPRRRTERVQPPIPPKSGKQKHSHSRNRRGRKHGKI